MSLTLTTIRYICKRCGYTEAETLNPYDATDSDRQRERLDDAMKRHLCERHPVAPNNEDA